MAPPSNCPTRTGGSWQLCSISSANHAMTRAASIGRSTIHSEAPWPGRSGTITRCEATRSGMISNQWVAFPIGPCSSRSGGPSPPSSTAVEMPARSSRRSLTGLSARSRRRASSPRIPATSSDLGPCALRCACALTMGFAPRSSAVVDREQATREGGGRASGEHPKGCRAMAWVVFPSTEPIGSVRQMKVRRRPLPQCVRSRRRRRRSHKLVTVGEGGRRRS